jgi:hypothetical protein
MQVQRFPYRPLLGQALLPADTCPAPVRSRCDAATHLRLRRVRCLAQQLQ